MEFGLVESCEDVPFEVLSGNRIGGIPPKYRELVASKEHSDVVGKSAPKVL